MKIQLGAFYLDALVEDVDPTRPILVNRDPGPGDVDIPVDTHVRLTTVDPGAPGLLAGATTVTIRTSSGYTAVVWDGAGFHADWAGSTFTPRASGGGVIDEHEFDLVRAAPFISLETVEVQVTASTADLVLLDTTYAFTIEDLTAPVVLSAHTRGLRRLRVQFDEPVEQATGTAGDALRIHNISGGIILGQSNIRNVTAPVDRFTSADVGLYVGVAGAANSLNNGTFLVTSYVSARTVRVERDLVTETLPIDATVTIGPYRVAGVPDGRLLLPYFNPIVLSAEPVQDDLVELVLEQELTPLYPYTLETFQVDDLKGNRIDPVQTVAFTSEALPIVAGRSFDLWDMIPQANKDDDLAGDLERFVRVLNEPVQLLFYDIDRFADLTDIDLIEERNLDALLAHLGNPFSFAARMTQLGKRRLAEILVQVYQRKGTELGMEAVINFLLDLPVNVRPYAGPDDSWLLGLDELGVPGVGGAVLGPGTRFLLYSFEVISPRALIEDERRVIDEIVEFMKPAHTHYVRLVEPEAGVPLLPSEFWILGVSFLGEGTGLGL